MDEDRSFVVADVPGLIEGAHTGQGLGDQFLSHLERTKVLVHVIDVSATGRNAVDDFEIIQRELRLFRDSAEPDAPGAALADKPQLAAANKIDALDDPARLRRLKARLAKSGIPLYPVSAATGEGVSALLEAIWQKVDAARRGLPAPAAVE
jgi:GTP-binding protein